ncbi:MAG: hypothetical protein IJ192_09045 [Clostridia bacterium]|nr:hypothetical protein [Clostridia bacterium]
MEKDKTVIVKKIIVAAMTVLIIAYIISVVLKANFTQVKTETANIMTVSDAIPVSGYFIRDEHMVTYDGDGVISYTVEDGSKISKNEAAAYVYSNAESATDKRLIDKLEAQITSLQQLEKTADTISALPDDLDKNINSLLSQVKLNTADRNFTEAEKNADDILYNINERQLVTGKVKGFSEKIKQLQKQVDELKKNYADTKNSKAVKSPATGYFVSSADGYENIYTTEDVENIMPGDLSENKIKKKSVDKDVIGKTIEGVNWYIACEVSADDAIRIKNASDLSVDIPLASSDNISVELYSVNQKTKTSDAVVILKGDYMNSEMAGIRQEDISIVLHTYKGIYVSKNAIHEETITETVTDKNGKTKTETNTVTGVYIMVGNELQFKQIKVLYSGEDFVICKQDMTDEDMVTDEVGILKAYDDVIVEGANLYDGKIINRSS